MGLDSSSPFRRFMKLHILAGRSGEFHVAGQDLEVVRGILEKRGVLMSRPPGSGRLEGKTRMCRSRGRRLRGVPGRQFMEGS